MKMVGKTSTPYLVNPIMVNEVITEIVDFLKIMLIITSYA